MTDRARPRPYAVRGVGHSLATYLATGALLFATGGCAAIGGNQRPVTVRDLATPSVCPSQQQLTGSPAAGEGMGAYRDRIVMDCVKAINAQYLKFRVDLHRSAVGTNLATDLVSLGLTTGASIASGATAKRLAAGGAFVIGAGTAINKDVFYQQTLPAIEAVMDANRDKVLTNIVDSEKADPEGKSYTLTNAGFDLDAYQAAGDLYRAINELNRTAAMEAASAKQALAISQQKPADAGFIVPIDASVAPRFFVAIGAVKKIDGAVPAELARLKALASALNVPVAADEPIDQIKRDVVVALNRRIEVAGVDKQQAQIAAIEALLK